MENNEDPFPTDTEQPTTPSLGLSSLTQKVLLTETKTGEHINKLSELQSEIEKLKKRILALEVFIRS